MFIVLDFYCHFYSCIIYWFEVEFVFNHSPFRVFPIWFRYFISFWWNNCIRCGAFGRKFFTSPKVAGLIADWIDLILLQLEIIMHHVIVRHPRMVLYAEHDWRSKRSLWINVWEYGKMVKDPSIGRLELNFLWLMNVTYLIALQWVLLEFFNFGLTMKSSSDYVPILFRLHPNIYLRTY
jgi:hypothetical protein